MQLVRGLNNYQKQGNLHLALGNFDGVHKGHQVLVGAAIARAESEGGKSGVLLFEPHPLKVLAPAMAPRMLISLERKLELFAALGVDEVIIADFDREVAKWSPQYFAQEILCARLGMAGAFVGFNYSFGHKGAGDPKLLANYGEQMGFEVKVIPAVEINEIVVSSTVIRNSVEAGEVDIARQLLGYTPSINGIVVAGEKRGRSIGFPTANIAPPSDMLIPGIGVYASLIRLQHNLYPAVLNIGQKPTFHDEYPLTIEAHLLDYAGEFYDEEVEALLLKQLRTEVKFTSVEQLIAQIHQDIDQARTEVASWQATPLELSWLT